MNTLPLWYSFPLTPTDSLRFLKPILYRVRKLHLFVFCVVRTGFEPVCHIPGPPIRCPILTLVVASTIPPPDYLMRLEVVNLLISTHHLFCLIGLNIREKPNFSNVCYCTYLTSSNCCSQDRIQTCYPLNNDSSLFN